MITALALTASLVATPIAIENVRVEVGDGTVLDATTVIIDKGRIDFVGLTDIPDGAERIDGRGKVLTPGLIDVLTQLGLTEIGLENATNDNEMKSPVTPGFRAADGFNPRSIRFAIEREEGVTSAITSPTGTLLYGTGAWIDLSGKVSAMPDPTRPAAMFGGVTVGDASDAFGSRGGLWLRLREVFEDVRYYMANRAAFQKGDARELSLGPVHLEAMIPVVEGKLPLVLYVHRAGDIQAALRFAREQKVKLVIAGGKQAWTVAKEIAAAGVPVILRPSEQAPMSFDSVGARDDAAAILAKAGVKVIISAADWDQNVRRLRQEAGTAVANGLPRLAALRAITASPAEVFGRAGEIGTVAAGKRANLVLWSGDPLELSTVAERVWIDGASLPFDNRQRQLAERYRRR
jgi:imidazolonepropionase-like amidohydrolase